MTVVDRDYAVRTLKVLALGIDRGKFMPSGDERCLTCTRSDTQAARDEIFLCSLRLGMQVARLLTTHAVEKGVPFPWCLACSLTISVVASHLSLASHDAPKEDPVCIWHEGGLEPSSTRPPVAVAIMGMALGLLTREPPLCAECRAIFRSFPDATAALAPS